MRKASPAFPPRFLSEKDAAPMNTSPFHPGPLDDLTQQELEALSAIKAGRGITVALRQRLELLDLAEESLHGWMLTPAGDWRLGAGR